MHSLVCWLLKDVKVIRLEERREEGTIRVTAMCTVVVVVVTHFFNICCQKENPIDAEGKSPQSVVITGTVKDGKSFPFFSLLSCKPVQQKEKKWLALAFLLPKQSRVTGSLPD